MPDIFISYRHDDDHAARGLAKRLQDVFSIFFDTDLKAGGKINEEAEEALREVRIVLAILGKGWFSERNLTRMRDPDDWIHWELKRALDRAEVILIPVMVDAGIAMPKKEQLPEPLHSFLMRKAVQLHHETWDEDVSDFIDSLHLQLRMRPAARTRPIAISSEIPYLCDRVQQEQDFEDLAMKAQDKRTLVCILHGHKYEAHAGFVTRLRQRHTLEQAFGASSTGVDVFPLEWNRREAREKRYEDLLRSSIKRSAMKHFAARDEELLKFLRNMARPAVLMLQLSWSDLEEYGRTLLKDLSRAWDNIIAQLDGTPSQALLLWINLSYEDANQEIDVADLPQLEKLAPVRESDIQTWLSLDEVRQVVAGHESALLSIANDQRYCIKPGQVHMLRFAEAAHELLNSRR
jgi:hypothetical protein